MELRAILELLKTLPEQQPIVIMTDSQYAMNVFTEWLPIWRSRGMKTSAKKPVENQDLIVAIDREIVSRGNVTFEWVRGHAGHELNEQADRLANAAARKAQAEAV